VSVRAVRGYKFFIRNSLRVKNMKSHGKTKTAEKSLLDDFFTGKRSPKSDIVEIFAYAPGSNRPNGRALTAEGNVIN